MTAKKTFLARLANVLGFGLPEALPTPTHRETVCWPGVRPGTTVLFLDFDGVLHPNMSETFEFLPELYRILDVCPAVDVVISSNWRHSASRDYLLKIFDNPYRHRIRDVTGPELSGRGARQNEITIYAASHHVKRWVAVDDEADIFGPDCRWLCLVPRAEGLGRGHADRVIALLSRTMTDT